MLVETAAAGWYRERPDSPSWRFWDGQEWTDYVSPDGDVITTLATAEPVVEVPARRLQLLLMSLLVLAVIVAFAWLRTPPPTTSIGF